MFGFFIPVYALFLCDSYATPYDAVLCLWLTVKLWWYNMPVFAVVYGLLSLLWSVASLVMNSDILTWDGLLLLLVLINIMTNFYVKKIHEQHSLYGE
jgi:hypothetical protein